ncbi:MCM DNA helicase complex subunit [Blastocladiella emersonii ATCC 22665]|nr:MCM DNA helicase complex subunit [Blastocladiella emersonii ATCC 22665]
MADAAPQPGAAAPRPILTLETVQEAFNERVVQFTQFLQRDFRENVDQTNIKAMAKAGRTRLIVDVDELRHYDRDLAQHLLDNPMDYLPAFDRALKDVMIADYNPTVPGAAGGSAALANYQVGLRGSFGDNHVSPRSLGAVHIGKLIALEGIVTRCSLVRPKMVRSVHYCDRTQLFTAREYRDATMLGDGMPTGTTFPTTDDNGNPLTTEFGLCTFRDHQTVSLQEMPERAPPGQLPRSLDVILDDDLVDACKPGDRVQIVGVYRAVSAGTGTGTFRTVMLANHVRQLDKEVAQPTLTETDLRNIRQLARRKSVVDLLARSLAPSIFGHPWIKKALLLLLLGGLEHNLANGTHIRGDINILLLGDPSTAKSQFLRFVIQMAPLAIATTGRGSSGVGLTAAVTQDQETGERRLEAGAMVLADRGVVCIDEFDKMSDQDRVAIHEVMEQQTITIAKAGIHTSLNARCSVVAAANPTYGQYDEHLEPHRNIRLPDSLLSRFDLLFIVLDKTDEATDRRLSSHVLRMHRYLPPGIEEGQPIPANAADTQFYDLDNDTAGSGGAGAAGGASTTGAASAAREVPVFERATHYQRLQQDFDSAGVQNTPATRSSTRRTTRNSNAANEIVTMAFLKKYIHYAKSRIKPVLTQAASDVITEAYARFRNEKASEEGKRRTLPITARTLETLIRLATAHAKARLAREVDEDDAEAATELLEYVLFKEFRRKRKPRAPKRRKVVDGEEVDLDSDEEETDAAIVAAAVDAITAASSSQVSGVTASGQPGLTALLDSSQVSGGEDRMDVDPPAGTADLTGKLAAFKSCLDAVFQETNGSVPAGDLAAFVNRAGARLNPAAVFSAEEVTACLAAVEEAAAVFVDHESGVVYRV